MLKKTITEYFWVRQVFELMIIVHPGTADNENRIAIITELSQVFYLKTILLMDILIIQINGIINFTNHFKYLNGLYFIYSSQLIDWSRFCAMKFNDSIKCNNYIHWAAQNPHAMVD